MILKDPDCGPCITTQTPSGETITFEHQFPKSLSHHYPVPALGAETIPVYRGPLEHEGTRYHGIIAIKLDPRPRLLANAIRSLRPTEIVGFLEGINQRQPAEWVTPESLNIPVQGVPPAARTAQKPKARNQAGLLRRDFEHLGRTVVGNPVDIDSLTFFLINGWYSEDGLNTCYDGIVRQGRLETKLGGWQLRLEPRGDHSMRAVRDHQRLSGKSTVTHIGRIRRDNGAAFHADDAIKVLDVVQTMTDFAMGRVTAIILPVGWMGSTAAWAAYECSRAVDRPLGPTPFLHNAITTMQLNELYRRGYETHPNQLRWDVFKNALGYLLAAEHDAAANMMVMLPISALQALSYAHLVEELPVGDPAHLSASKWRACTTEEQLRRLLKVVNATLTIPSHMTHLESVRARLAAAETGTASVKAGVQSPIDALSCAVKLRNEVAHPKTKHFGRWTTVEWAETGFAATEMFHLVLLWWLHYDEKYLPRTAEFRTAEDLVHVPWHI